MSRLIFRKIRPPLKNAAGDGSVHKDRSSDLKQRSLKPERLRLLYNLAAAHAHRALETELPDNRKTHLEKAERRAAEAVDWAEQLQKEVKRQPLGSALDERTYEFVTSVYLPSTKVLWAGVLMDLLAVAGSPLDGKPVPDELIAEVEGTFVSYRTRYNLACYNSSKARLPGSDGKRKHLLDEAYSHLLGALRAAPRSEQMHLATSALTDPSLRTLRDDEHRNDKVASTLAFYGPTDSVVQTTTNTPLSSLEAIGATHARLLALAGVLTPSDLPSSPSELADLLQPMRFETAVVEKWFGAIDLARLGPLSVIAVNALGRVGVHGVTSLAAKDSTNLFAALADIGPNAPKGWKMPTLAEIDHWVLAARRAQRR